MSPAWQVDSLPLSHQGSPHCYTSHKHRLLPQSLHGPNCHQLKSVSAQHTFQKTWVNGLEEEVARIHRRTAQKRSSWPRYSWWYNHSPRTRHRGWEFKWALGSITMNKASGGKGVLVELFQILTDDAVKVLHSICQQIWKTQQRSQDWKRSVFIPVPKKGNAKECSNYRTIALISYASKVMHKS